MVLYLSETYPGSVHDKNICDNEALEFHKSVSLFVDLGFVGLSCGKAIVIIPYKKKKKQGLTAGQKEYNKGVSRVRVQVEHIIAGVKINRKVKEKFRGRLFAREDTVMLLACGLHNLKIRLKKHITTNSV
jgi:DDE superfamily endonuclease